MRFTSRQSKIVPQHTVGTSAEQGVPFVLRPALGLVAIRHI